MLGVPDGVAVEVVMFVVPIALTLVFFRHESMPGWWPWALAAICFFLGFGVVHELYVKDPVGIRAAVGLPEDTDPLGVRAFVGISA